MASQVESLKRISFANGTEFIVDGFRFQRDDVKNYVLTHFHSDHTTGLSPRFSAGLIYCTEETARMVVRLLGIDEQYVRAVAWGVPTEIQGVRVTMLDAGHCPGSAIVAFEEISTARLVLHTGDLRASQNIREELCAWLSNRSVDELYLDTTYCAPKWDFPTQEVACAWMEQIVKKELARESETLFVVGSYQIGKERAARAVAKAADSPIFLEHRRLLTIQLAGWGDEILADGSSLWCTDKAKCKVWMQPLGKVGHDALSQYLDESKGRFRAVVAFKPTGWVLTRAMLEHGVEAIRPWTRNEGSTRVYQVPYSEHSSFPELHALVAAIKPNQIIPTVNAATPASRERVLKPLLGLLHGERGKLDHYWKTGKVDKPVATSEKGKQAISHVNLPKGDVPSQPLSWVVPVADLSDESVVESTDDEHLVDSSDDDVCVTAVSQPSPADPLSIVSSTEASLQHLDLARQQSLFLYYERLRAQSHELQVFPSNLQGTDASSNVCSTSGTHPPYLHTQKHELFGVVQEAPRRDLGESDPPSGEKSGSAVQKRLLASSVPDSTPTAPATVFKRLRANKLEIETEVESPMVQVAEDWGNPET